MSKFIIPIAAAALVASAAAPGAENTSPAAAPTSWEQQIEQLFTRFDRDADGYINETEAKAYKGLENAFPRIAKTGKLDKQQFVAWYKVYDMSPAEE